MNGRGNLNTALLPLLVCLAVVVSGCGRTALLEDDEATSARLGRSAGGGRSATDPCSLLSRSEVEAVLGSGADESSPPIGPAILPGMRMCPFSARGEGGRSSFLLAGIVSKGAAEQFRRYVEVNAAFGLEELPELGTEAVWDEKLGTLLVLTSKHVVGMAIVVAGRPAGPDDRQRATWLADSALARL